MMKADAQTKHKLGSKTEHRNTCVQDGTSQLTKVLTGWPVGGAGGGVEVAGMEGEFECGSPPDYCLITS